jgi:hypothetical protein
MIVVIGRPLVSVIHYVSACSYLGSLLQVDTRGCATILLLSKAPLDGCPGDRTCTMGSGRAGNSWSSLRAHIAS